MQANNQSDDNKAFDMSRLSGKSGRSRMGGRSGRGGRPPAFGGGKDKAQEKEEVKGKDEAGPRKKVRGGQCPACLPACLSARLAAF